MLAHGDLARGEMILCICQIIDLRFGFVVRGRHLSGFQAEPLFRGVPCVKVEGVDHHHRARQGKDPIIHAGIGFGRILAIAEDRPEPGNARPAQLKGAAAEDRTIGIEGGTERAADQGHRRRRARQDQAQRLGDLTEIELAIGGRPQAQPTDIIRGESLADGLPNLL